MGRGMVTRRTGDGKFGWKSPSSGLLPTHAVRIGTWYWYNSNMPAFTAIIERDPDTGLLVGYVPGFPGAHSQGASMEELQQNLREVISMLLEDGEPKLENEFVGTQMVNVD